jgi:hypothetical protein
LLQHCPPEHPLKASFKAINDAKDSAMRGGDNQIGSGSASKTVASNVLYAKNDITSQTGGFLIGSNKVPKQYDTRSTAPIPVSEIKQG